MEIIKRGKRSLLWRHYTGLGDNDRARCDYCHSHISFKGGNLINLKKHLKAKHPKAFMELNPDRQKDADMAEESDDEILNEATSCKDPIDEEVDDEQFLIHVKKAKSSPKRSAVWSHYSVPSKLLKRAKCNYCNSYISIKGGSTNLRKHLKTMHPMTYEDLENENPIECDEPEEVEHIEEIDDASDNEDDSIIGNFTERNKKTKKACNDSDQDDDDLELSAISHINGADDIEAEEEELAIEIQDIKNLIHVKNPNSYYKRSVIWMHFSVSPEYPHSATCDYCHLNVSSKGGSTNLRKHLKLKHSAIYDDIQNAKNSWNDIEEVYIAAEPEENDVAAEPIEDSLSCSPPLDKMLNFEGRKHSALWIHFTKLSDKNKAKCDYCKSHISIKGGSLLNLKKHLKSRHPKAFRKLICYQKKMKAKKNSDKLHRGSAVWAHYTLSPKFPKRAECNYCHNYMKFDTGVSSNLRKHIRAKHPNVYEKMRRDQLEKEKDTEPDENDTMETEEDLLNSQITNDDPNELDSSQYNSNKGKGQGYTKRSMVWMHFSISRKFPGRARCDYCHKNISFRGGTTSNLRKHLKARHLAIYEESERNNMNNCEDTGEDNVSVGGEENDVASEHEGSTNSSVVMLHECPNKRKRLSTSYASTNKAPNLSHAETREDGNSVFVKFVVSELNLLKDPFAILETKWKIQESLMTARKHQIEISKKDEQLYSSVESLPDSSHKKTSPPRIEAYIIANVEPSTHPREPPPPSLKFL